MAAESLGGALWVVVWALCVAAVSSVPSSMDALRCAIDSRCVTLARSEYTSHYSDEVGTEHKACCRFSAAAPGAEHEAGCRCSTAACRQDYEAEPKQEPRYCQSFSIDWA